MAINHGAVAHRALRQGLRVLAQYQAVNHIVAGPYMLWPASASPSPNTTSPVGWDLIYLYFLMKSLVLSL